MVGYLKSAEMQDMSVVEGSYAVARAVAMCRPNVIAVYPITPQTHIVEGLSKMVINEELDAEYVCVESEFSSISTLIGASAVGARTFTGTTSQGLALMHEGLFNASGLRLPILMVVVNRALSAPINIWNDQQDSVAQRDAGWIQMYAENAQEASDMVPQAYRVAEDRDVLLPIMVCMDGYILSHTYEPVVLHEQEITDEFLPPYDPVNVLDPKNPLSFGMLGTPEVYTEARYMQEQAMEMALDKIVDAAHEFKRLYGRWYGDLVDTYRMDDAEIAIVSMGSVIGTIKDVVDTARNEGVAVGVVKVRVFRPFPKKALLEALGKVKAVVVVEKDISVGMNEGALATAVKVTLYDSDAHTKVLSRVAGLGGRDIPPSTIRGIIEEAERYLDGGDVPISSYCDLNEEVL
ncbi:MAG: transketolase C-terminal domain-containing protein [Methermicoccaceae archaeon]